MEETCAHIRFNYISIEDALDRYTWWSVDIEGNHPEDFEYKRASMKNIDGRIEDTFFECAECGKRFEAEGEFPDVYPVDDSYNPVHILKES